MKTRFSTLDIVAVIPEIQETLYGMRILNVYDIDHKTYLIKFQKPDHKATLLFESGNRIHLTEFEWPKNTTPSGFSMKLRKHLRSRRLEKISQIGIDRIIDMQFGSGEAAYHVILELYDRGNIVLTDYEYNILNILRPRTDESQDVKFAVREKYPLDTARQKEMMLPEKLRSILQLAQEGDNLRKILNPHLACGTAALEHCMRQAGIPENAQLGKNFSMSKADDFQKLIKALEETEILLESFSKGRNKGFIIQKLEKKPGTSTEEDSLLTNVEFHPVLFNQHSSSPHEEYDSFHRAIDTFFSKMESQKLDMKALQLERSAVKKLENVKKDHVKRLETLQKEQESDIRKGQLIEMNLQLVDSAITIVRSAVANQIDWTEINGLVKEAQGQGDQVAGAIKGLKLDTNHMTLLLKDIYLDEDEEGGKPIKVDIDLGLSAYANARKYYDMKRHAAQKEQKTIDASQKALKSAERKTKQTLKDVATAVKINKARKTNWFEKFLWFISSENYLVIGGRDQQQNEMVVKKYLKAGDLYVHADLHGASSVIIKNTTGGAVPPKTLNEAGTMAVCNSAAWDAKVVTSAWWVYHHQVSKTAPTGEYLTTGSFMIRGKKNFLPPCYLIYGYGFLFKIDEDSLERHRNERRARLVDETESISDHAASEVTTEDDIELSASDSDSATEQETSESNSAGGEFPGTEEGLLRQEPDEFLKNSSELVELDVEDQINVTDTDKQNDVDLEFPDTSISLQHIQGEKFELQRSTSQSTTTSVSEGQEEHVGSSSTNKGRLSAKQRRQLKKKNNSQNTKEEYLENAEATGAASDDRSSKFQSEDKTENIGLQQTHMKRGKKSKLKKIKEKYGDQDEEERRLKMEILASSGAKKECKQKLKKQKQPQKDTRNQQQQQNQNTSSSSRPINSKAGAKEWHHPAKLEHSSTQSKADDQQIDFTVKYESAVPQEEQEKVEPEEDEPQLVSDDVHVVSTLTGLPQIEDTLLYCVPVCAPYSAMLNYKYKVKLTPGSTKRGKAAKHAYNLFLHDRNITTTEKDLLKVVKDSDMSRNIPGKVKIAASGISKVKKDKIKK